MPGQVHHGLNTLSLKLLAYSALIITESNASPTQQSIRARDMGSSTQPSGGGMTIKNALGWVFAGLAVIIVGSVFIWRSRFLRARNRPLHDFFAFIEAPQRTGGTPQWRIRPTPRTRVNVLAPISLDRRGRGQTRATDTDSEGRRGGGPDSDDPNGDLTEGDLLPAYEVKGGPPNYKQFLAVDLGTGTNARLQISETLPVGTSLQPQSPGASPETTNPSVQTNPPPDIQLPRPPPPSYCPEMSTTHSPADR